MAKPLKTAGIFGIILLAFSIISILTAVLMTSFLFSSIASRNLDSFNLQYKFIINAITIIILITYLLSIGFLYGFVALGKRFQNKALLITAWIYIILSVLAFVLTLVFFISGNLYPDPMDFSNNSDSTITGIFRQKIEETPVMGAIVNMFGDAGFWPLVILFLSGSIALKLIFSISLYKLKHKDVPLAEVSGILEIISIVLGFVGTVAIILETIMFFKASRKFESSELQANQNP